jgi:hypothetical protein
MATAPIGAESAREYTEPAGKDRAFFEAHAAWRRAKAEWDLALYAPGMVGEDLPEDEDTRLCTAHCEALDAFFSTPSKSYAGFIWKLRAFRDEEVFHNDNVEQVLATLITDLHRLVMEDRRGD